MALWQPICWALSEGANVMGTTGEMIFYSTTGSFLFYCCAADLAQQVSSIFLPNPYTCTLFSVRIPRNTDSPFLRFMHITALSKLNYADLGLTSGKYSDPVNSGVAHHHPLGNTVSNARSDATAAAGEPKRGLWFFAGRKQHEAEGVHAPTTAAV